jgi:hypothetical protein
MHDVVICTNAMSLSVFRVNVSIAVPETLVGPAACLGRAAGGKNAYFCKPPNHVSRSPQAFTLLAKPFEHMREHNYWFKISCLLKLERQCWPRVTSCLFVRTKKKYCVCACMCVKERERERNQVCTCTLSVNTQVVWLYVNATDEKLSSYSVLCNVGNS